MAAPLLGYSGRRALSSGVANCCWRIVGGADMIHPFATGPVARRPVRLLLLLLIGGGLIVRVGIGHDTHRLVEGRPLILGGVRVEFDRGLAGHSDADVVLHAVADALLGAAALGDIGELFPDTDPQWAGLDSAVLLDAVRTRVAEAGWSPVNCDIIIHAERPKLSAHKPAIRAGVAGLLGIPESAVNVKAKTGERVGHLGRGEAIACQAVVLCEARGA